MKKYPNFTTKGWGIFDWAEEEEKYNPKYRMIKKYKILLTGDKGFIGTHLKEKLKKLEHEVYGFDIKTSPLEDVRSIFKVMNVFNKVKPEIVIHLAALTGVRESVKNSQDYFETNVTGTSYVIERAKRCNVRKFLFASSSSVYGEQQPPLRENMICDCQLSPYAFSKKSGELICKSMTGKEMSIVVFRPFTVYGENGREDMVISKIIKAGKTGKVFYKYGDGNSSRGYTNVHDLVDGIVKLIDYEPQDNFEIFNLGGQEVIKLNDLIEIVKSEFPNLKVEETRRNLVDVVDSFADISKAKRLLDWEPKRNFIVEIKKLCQT